MSRENTLSGSVSGFQTIEIHVEAGEGKIILRQRDPIGQIYHFVDFPIAMADDLFSKIRHAMIAEMRTNAK